MSKKIFRRQVLPEYLFGGPWAPNWRPMGPPRDPKRGPPGQTDTKNDPKISARRGVQTKMPSCTYFCPKLELILTQNNTKITI